MKDQHTISCNVHKVWKMKVPPRMKVFAWLVFYNKILTRDNLAKRGWQLASICFLCRDACENIKHMFSECTLTLEVYDKVSLHFKFPQRDWRRTLQEMQAQNWIVRKGGGSKMEDIIIITMFICWRERCRIIFKEEANSTEYMKQEVIDQRSWLKW